MVPDLPRFNPVDRRSALPLWAQVNADIERRLRAGEFADAFPGEMALVEQYGVSRHTIREALRQLRSSGLVDAGRGRPPRVVSTEITQPQGSLYSLFTSVRAAGHSQRSIVRALQARADGTVAVRLGLEESTPLIYLERIRLVDEEPLAIDRVWLPARLAAPLLDVDFAQTSLYAELRDRCGVRLTGGHEQIRAVVPTTAEQALLAIPPRTAALAIDRTGELGGQSVEWRQTIVRGDRFSLPLRAHAGVEDYFGTPRLYGQVHGGVDFSLAGLAEIPVSSACTGMVASVGESPTLGTHVVVDCGDGWSFVAGFLAEATVGSGDGAAPTTEIGKGTPGGHLHVELRYQDVAVDPAGYIWG